MSSKQDIEIVMNELILVREKYQKKEDKILSKAKDVCVVFKGCEYRSEADVMDAYGSDMMTCSQADRLIEKLEAKQKVNVESKWSGVIALLDGCIASFKNEIDQIDLVEKKQKDTDERIKNIMEYQHCSYAEALKQIQDAEEVTRQSEEYERMMQNE